MPEWRNWQTRWTQNPVHFTVSVGSTPSSGTPVIPYVQELDKFRLPAQANLVESLRYK